jgi:hypothetical protein
MVQLVEFRIVMPYNTEEYKIGQVYSVARASVEATTGKEGVELVENKKYVDEKTNVQGKYTLKIYHLGGHVPAWLRTIIPESALKLEERAWDVYPNTKTVLTSPFLGEKFTFSIESKHAADRGEQENIHNLNAKQLKKRKVVYLDIATDELTDKNMKSDNCDPKKYTSKKTGKGPLTKGWQKTAETYMCCYKLVTVRCKIFGLKKKVENHLISMETNIFLKFHKQLFCWTDDWYGQTLEDVLRMELDMAKEAGKKIESHTKAVDGENNKTKEDEEKAKKALEQLDLKEKEMHLHKHEEKKDNKDSNGKETNNNSSSSDDDEEEEAKKEGEEAEEAKKK